MVHVNQFLFAQLIIVDVSLVYPQFVRFVILQQALFPAVLIAYVKAAFIMMELVVGLVMLLNQLV